MDFIRYAGFEKTGKKQNKTKKTFVWEPCIIAAPYQGALNVFYRREAYHELRGKFYIIARKKANSENFTIQNFFIPF